ncbi:MAG: MATE family efflux transporter [Lachnospiraceae bacterium]|nr:MATE family efflux transporter [Lachnospiraceae bacterium]
MKATSYRKVFLTLIKFSMPLILSGILQQLYLWVDAFIVGRYVGENALAAIGVNAAVTEFVTFMIVGFTTGLGVIAAQRFGAGDHDTIRKLFSTFLVILAGGFIFISVMGNVFSGQILTALSTPGDIFGYADDFLKIIFIGVPFLCIYNLYAAMLRAEGNTKASFFAIVLSSVINVVLDILLVAVFNMGVQGAAIATVISQIIMAIYIVLYASRRYEDFRIGKNIKVFSKDVVALGCSFAIPLMLQQSLTAFGNLVIQGVINSFGSQTVAAMTTAYRIEAVAILLIFSFGVAISTMVAQSKGAGNAEDVKRYSIVGFAICIVTSLMIIIVLYKFGGALMGIFGVEAQTASIGIMYFQIMSVFYYIPFGAESAFRGTIEGNGNVMYSTIVGVAAIVVRIGFSFIFAGSMGNAVIAHAEGVGYILMIACYLPYIIKLWSRKKSKASKKHFQKIGKTVSYNQM